MTHNRSITPSWLDPDSPHYTDQMSLYSDQKTKTMTLDLARIRDQAEKTYKPVPNFKNPE